MRVPGVTCHHARIWIRDQNLDDDDAMEALLEQIRVEISLPSPALTSEPDYMVMGMSAGKSFWGGMEGNRQFIRQIKSVVRTRCSDGAEACERLLHLFGAKRIGVVTPHQPIGDEMSCAFSTKSI